MYLYIILRQRIGDFICYKSAQWLNQSCDKKIRGDELIQLHSFASRSCRLQLPSIANRMLLKRGTGNGERGMGNGEWGTGKWGMGNGEWGMGNGEWGMGNGEWGMGNGEWGMGNGEWGMGNGEWGKQLW